MADSKPPAKRSKHDQGPPTYFRLPKEDWDNLAFTEKMEKLLPGSWERYADAKTNASSDMPSPEKIRKTIELTVQHVEGLLSKRLKGSMLKEKEASAVPSSSVVCDEPMDLFDDEEEEGGMAFSSKPSNPRYMKDFITDLKRYRAFIEELSNCPFYYAFHAADQFGKEVRCPCGPHWKNWRIQFGIESRDCQCSRKGKPFSEPAFFVAHMKDVAGREYSDVSCWYHECVLKFVEALYTDHWGDIGHKALYPKTSKSYELAEKREETSRSNIEKAEKDRLLRKNELETNKVKALEARLEDSRKWSPAFAQEHEFRQKLLHRMMWELLDGDDAVNSSLALTKKEREYTKTRIDKTVRLWNLELHADLHKEKEEDKYSKAPQFNVETNFKLQPLFDRLFENRKNDDTFLFCGLHEETRGKLLVPINVVFSHVIGDLETEEQQEFEAIDHGGPTREFLSGVWDQVASLSIGPSEWKLFNTCGQMCIPNTGTPSPPSPSPLSPLRPREEENILKEKLVHRAKLMYRALGRLFTFCISNKHPIADHVIPKLYRKYLFCGMEPKDEEYKLHELIVDFYELLDPSGMKKYLQEFIDDDKNEKESVIKYILDEWQSEMSPGDDLKKAFRRVLQYQFIEQQEFALTNLSRGLTLGCPEVVDFPACFAGMSPLAMEEMLFATQAINVEAVIDALVPVYTQQNDDKIILSCLQAHGEDEDSQVLERFRTFQKRVLERIHHSTQRDVVKGELVDFLRRQNTAYIGLFVYFVTAYRYIPRVDFKIEVEFNLSDYTTRQQDDTEKEYEYVDPKTVEGALPQAHTCACVLKIPATMYDGNMEMFFSKLTQSLENHTGGFDQK